jgi:hypothetical protein
MVRTNHVELYEPVQLLADHETIEVRLGPPRCYSPRHLTHVDPSLHESKVIL